MLTNGFLKAQGKFKVSKKIEKAILTGIGVTASKEAIKKAAVGLYDDIQKIIHDLLKELEEKGKIKAQETKKVIKALQKRSEAEKIRIYKKLEKEGKSLLNTAKDLIITPIAIAKQVATTVKKSKNNHSKKVRKRKNQRKKNKR